MKYNKLISHAIKLLNYCSFVQTKITAPYEYNSNFTKNVANSCKIITEPYLTDFQVAQLRTTLELIVIWAC